jgi:hypothetical protein
MYQIIPLDVLERMLGELKELVENATETAFFPENLENSNKYAFLAGKRAGYADALSRFRAVWEEIHQEMKEKQGDLD